MKRPFILITITTATWANPTVTPVSPHFPKEIKTMDELQRDLFYKSILNYDFKRLHQKYPFLKKNTVEKMKREFSL